MCVIHRDVFMLVVMGIDLEFRSMPMTAAAMIRFHPDARRLHRMTAIQGSDAGTGTTIKKLLGNKADKHQAKYQAMHG